MNQPMNQHNHSPPPKSSYDSPFFHLDETLVIPHLKQCGYCHHQEAVNLCSGCKSMFYCSRPCQQQHWSEHKHNCKRFQKLLAELARREKVLIKALQDLPDEDEFDPDPIPMDQDSLRFPTYEMLGAMSCGLAKVGCTSALREAVLFAIRALRLDRRDIFHMSDHVPYSLIRLHNDQHAFDIIKWYGLLPDCHQCYLAAPLLNISNADRSEDIEQLLSDRPNHKFKLSFHNLIPLLLIKIRLVYHFVNVDKFYNFLAVVERLSESPYLMGVGKLAGNDRVLHLIKSYVLDSQNLSSRQFTVRDKFQLTRQVIKIILKGEFLNKNLWLALLTPDHIFGNGWEEKEFPRRSYRYWSQNELMFLARNYVSLGESLPEETCLLAKIISKLYKGGNVVRAMKIQPTFVTTCVRMAETPDAAEDETADDGTLINANERHER
jgi:hypothetical protein